MEVQGKETKEYPIFEENSIKTRYNFSGESSARQ